MTSDGGNTRAAAGAQLAQQTMAPLLTIAVVFPALMAWVSVVYVIPSCLRSSLVSDLWQIRDRIVDDLAADRFADRDAAGSLVGAVELLIRNADKLTPARAWFFGRMPETLAESIPDMLPAASGAGADQWVAYRHEVEQRVERFLRVGSVSAWLAFPARLLGAVAYPSLQVICRGLALIEHFDALELNRPY